MCKFFSFVTVPSENKKLYLNWEQRKKMRLTSGCDSHSKILLHYDIKTDLFNAYEYNPLTKVLAIDCINTKDDTEDVKQWLNTLDFKTIVEPLIVKPILNPLSLPVKIVTESDIQLLKKWSSVYDSADVSARSFAWDSIWSSVWSSVGVSVGSLLWSYVLDSAWDFVWNPVKVSVGAHVRSSVFSSVRAYCSSFFDAKYEYDFLSCNELWNSGLVPSFDGKIWRLHSGKRAKIVFEISQEDM
jgi:hypothetical protein